MRLLTVSLSSLLLVTATACSVSISGPDTQVDRAEVAKQISEQLEKGVGKAPDKVTCPDDLEAKVGATLRCELTEGGDTLGVQVKVTAVEGSNAKFDIQVDDRP